MKLLGQFPVLTRPTTRGEPDKHGITHKIVTKGHPVFVRPRRLAPDKLVTAKREFDDMIKLGVIEPSDSEWSSALHMVTRVLDFVFVYLYDLLVTSPENI